MREFKNLEKTKTYTQLVKVSCNKCGDANTDEEYDKERFSEINLTFGYGSDYDNERWSFDLCDDCLTELVKSFKHVPDGFGEDIYYAKYPQVMFERWKETGKIDLEAGMTPEEIENQGGSIYSEYFEDEESV